MISHDHDTLPDVQPVLQPPVMVDTDTGLSALHDKLSSATRIAVDTESNSLYAYRERVCLIQISTDRADFLLDPLAFSDPQAFAFVGDMLADRGIEKVFHAAEYDVMVLRRDFGWSFANIFDTSMAVRLLGGQEIGLGNILETRFGIHINKRHQRANWGIRPLSPDMIAYARQDIHYLLPLRDQLYPALDAAGFIEEFHELAAEVSSAVWTGGQFDPEGFWRINGARSLSPVGAAILRELYLYREEQARHLNLPVFKVLGDAVLIEVASYAPRSFDGLRRAKGISEGHIRRYGQGLLNAVRHGQATPPPKPPFMKRNGKDDLLMRRFDALHLWRKERALQRGVPSDIIMPKDALWELAQTAPRTLDQLAELKMLGPWRLRMYGAEVLRALAQVDETQSSDH